MKAKTSKNSAEGGVTPAPSQFRFMSKSLKLEKQVKVIECWKSMLRTISIQDWTLQAITAAEKLTLMYTVDGQMEKEIKFFI